MIATNYQHWLCGELPGRYSLRLIMRNGGVRIVEIRATPIVWGGATATLNLMMDITEQKQAENSLRTSQIMLTEAMDLAHMANWECDDRTGMYTFDDRFYALYGTTSEREGGYRMPAEVYFREFVHPDDRDQVIEEVENARKTSDPHHVWRLEHRIIRRDGEVRHIVARIERTMDLDSYVIKIHGVNQDITEFKRAENLTQTTLHRLDSTISTLCEGFLMVSEDGKVEHVNQAFCDLYNLHDAPENLRGLTSHEIIKKIQDAYVSPVGVSAHIQELVTQGKPVNDYEITLQNGRIFKINYIPVIDAKGQRRGRVWYHHDITERKKAEEALASANRKLKLLSGITRHDIGNQLVALNSYIELSMGAIDNPGELKEFFANELKITDILAQQINFTKDYEDIGTKSPVWQNVSMLVSSAGSALPLGKIGLEIECHGLEVCADPLLEKVFYNLIDNSLHYGGVSLTAISVTAHAHNDDLQIIFEDDGSGISADDKKYLFTKGFGKHTGLGLFLIREILGITGISIAETGVPGHGARFEMKVPKGAFHI